MPQLAAYKWQPVGSKGSWQCRLCQYAFVIFLLFYAFDGSVRTRWNRRVGTAQSSSQSWVSNAIGWDDDDGGASIPTPHGMAGTGAHPAHGGGSLTHQGHAAGTAPAHPAAATRDTDSGGAGWIGACRKGTIPAVYPNSSEARTAHMQTVLARIGGCGRMVQAVMRDHVTTRTTPDHRKQALYGTDVIFNTLDTATPKGNLPNAATHFRMVNELANTKASTAESTWTLFFEDDAQLHADVALLYPTPAAVATLLRWSFAEATRRNLTMVTYGVCKGSRSECHTIDRKGSTDGHHRVDLATCVGDFRCANAYALPKWRATAIAEAYATLNTGAYGCPRTLMGGPHCPKDPFAFTAYLGGCRGVRGGAVQLPCRALVVGTNFVSPTANPKKKDHVGLFIQEKTKGFIKHYAVDRKILNGDH